MTVNDERRTANSVEAQKRDTLERTRSLVIHRLRESYAVRCSQLAAHLSSHLGKQ